MDYEASALRIYQHELSEDNEVRREATKLKYQH